jgi:hypothetical protein
LTCKGENAREIADKLNELEAKIRARLGHLIFGRDDEKLEAVVGCLLRERKATLAVAESCTGGLVASRLTDVPGSSDYFERGVVAYSLEAKERLLNVPASLLERHGAVSLEVARAMAAGVRRMAGLPSAWRRRASRVRAAHAGETRRPRLRGLGLEWRRRGARVPFVGGPGASEVPRRADGLGDASTSSSRHTHGRSVSAEQAAVFGTLCEIRDGPVQERLRAQADVSWVSHQPPH